MEKIEQAKADSLHMGHFGAIFLCALLLVFTAWMKSGFNFDLSGKQKEVKTYSYDQAKSEVLAELDNGSTVDGTDTQIAKSESQVAMLDPLSSAGQVLGASTGTGDSILPNAEETFTPQILASIQIKVSDKSGADAVRQYKIDAASVESNDESEQILADSNSTDPKILLGIPKKVQSLVADLMQVSVPQELVEYHKFKLIYYMELSGLAEGYGGVVGAPDPKDTGINIFSIMDKLQRISTDIQNKYGVQL